MRHVSRSRNSSSVPHWRVPARGTPPRLHRRFRRRPRRFPTYATRCQLIWITEDTVSWTSYDVLELGR